MNVFTLLSFFHFTYSEKSTHVSCTDRELVEASLRGDTESFETLVLRYENRVFRFLLRKHSSADTQDITQETFLQAWTGLKSYDSRWEFSTWLFTIAYRASAGFFRQKRRDVMRDASRDEEVLGRIPQPENGSAEETQISVKNIWDTAREVLPEPQMTAMWLFYVEEKSVREIAHIMGRTEVSVKMLLFRGRKKLQRSVRR